MSRIITFYSYKGGVGRTFALANVAVLLAKRGKRVLLMDWDLEAPGLHRYFKPYIQHSVPGPEGLIHLLAKTEAVATTGWTSYVTKVAVPDCEPIDLIASGDQAPNYVERVRNFSWNTFFENNAGGDLLNQWRDEWRASYDFVLLDSRAGITDTGGVCTIYLPDILVLVFSANEQSFERGVQIASGVQKARRDLSVPRPPLAVLPLPGRFDGRDEVEEAQFWLSRFAEELKPFYDDWLPKGLKPRQILELTKIPYITKFSFGEPLPVITQGVTDPEFPGFYLENIARLLMSDFEDAQQIVSPESKDRAGSIAELRSLLASIIDEPAIARAAGVVERTIGGSSGLSELLTEVRVSRLRQQRFDSAESYIRQALAMHTEALGSNHPAVRYDMNYLAELLMTTGRLDEAESLYRQIVETEVGLEGTSRMTTSTNLANLYRQMGRIEEAVEWNQRALHMAEMCARPGDPAVLVAYNNLAGLYREMGRSDEAVEWYQRALHRAEMSARPGDPAVLAAYNNLAGLYREMGRSDEAVEWYQRALHMAEMSARPGDPAVLVAYNNLAGLYREMGRSDEAVEWYQRALHRAEMGARPGDPAVLATYNNFAGLYREMGRSDEVRDWYERSLEISQRICGPESLQTANQMMNLGGRLAEQGHFSEAEAWFRRALANLRPGVLEHSPIGSRIRASLAQLLRERGRGQEADEISDSARYDVFVSYGSKDGKAVRPIVEKLTERGLRVWFDQQQLRPGDSIPHVISKAVESTSTLLVCIGEGNRGRWAELEVKAFVQSRMEGKQALIPVLLPGGTWESMPAELSQYQALDLRDGLTDEALENLSRVITRRRRRI